MEKLFYINQFYDIDPDCRNYIKTLWFNLSHKKVTYKFYNGANNTSFGHHAGFSIIEGSNNTCLGTDAGFSIRDGDYNLSVGSNSGAGLISGHNTIYIGAPAERSDEHDLCKINQIYNHAPKYQALPVVIDQNGQLGTISYYRSMVSNVENIHDNKVLNLKPRIFNYKDSQTYGLITDEVRNVCPNLMTNDDQVMSQNLIYLLLDVVKKQQHQIDYLLSKV